MRKAAIDLGTNTARLLIAETDGETITPILVKRHITRLGGGFTREQGLSIEARERTLAAMRDFAKEMAAHRVTALRAVATSAVRDAKNGREFCAEVFDEAGIKLEVIDGHEEGLLTLKGVFCGIDDKRGDFLVFDIGGGSTEYTLSSGEEMRFTRSLPLGVVRLTEGKGSVAEMEEKIDRELSGLLEEMEREGMRVEPGRCTLVGTAGTATTVAAIDLEMTDYDYRRVNNHAVSLERIRAIFAKLLPLSPSERLQVAGLEKGREDLIIAGLVLMIRTMETFGIDRLKVNDFGLLEGILLSVPDC